MSTAKKMLDYYEKFRGFKHQYLRKHREQGGFSPAIITPEMSLFEAHTPLYRESPECKVHDFGISYHNGIILKVSMTNVS